MHFIPFENIIAHLFLIRQENEHILFIDLQKIFLQSTKIQSMKKFLNFFAKTGKKDLTI